jgi:glycosyltransferase involved in cell wall biosynthesis
MLRVLTLSTLFPDATRPGFGIFVERQTQALAAQPEVEVHVVAPVGLPAWPFSLHPHYRPRTWLPPRETWHGLDVRRPRFRVRPGRGAHLAAKELARTIALGLTQADFGFDVIDAEFFWPDGVAAMQLAERFGTPFCVKARGSDIHHWGGVPLVREQILAAAQAAGGLLAVSEALKRDMAALGMAEEKIRAHYTGIDLERFRPVDRAAAKRRLGVEGPLIVSAGNLVPLKGHRLVVEALAQLPGVTLLIAGDGPEAAALESAIASAGLPDRARLLGGVAADEMPALLGAADLMVLPSEREGLANVWIESLACGTPILISDVGGAREVLDRPQAGRIVERDPGAIARAAREMLASPAQPQAVRAAAERFSWERNGRELAEHLRRIA